MTELSNETQAVFNQVIKERVTGDSRNKPGSGSYPDWFGYPSQYSKEIVTKQGRADFTQGHESDFGTLSAMDCCLLYSFFFARKHYKQARDLLKRASPEVGLPVAQPTLFVDLGCGPATALMAYADAYPGAAVDYLAIDRAECMTDLAQEIFLGLAEYGVIDKTSTFRRDNGFEGLTVDTCRPTVVAASFLFASATLPGQRDSLCNLVRYLFAQSQNAGLVFIYTNSIDARAEQEWVEFTAKMGWPTKISHLDIEGDSGSRYSAYLRYKKRSP